MQLRIGIKTRPKDLNVVTQIRLKLPDNKSGKNLSQ